MDLKYPKYNQGDAKYNQSVAKDNQSDAKYNIIVPNGIKISKI